MHKRPGSMPGALAWSLVRTVSTPLSCALTADRWQRRNRSVLRCYRRIQVSSRKGLSTVPNPSNVVTPTDPSSSSVKRNPNSVAPASLACWIALTLTAAKSRAPSRQHWKILGFEIDGRSKSPASIVGPKSRYSAWRLLLALEARNVMRSSPLTRRASLGNGLSKRQKARTMISGSLLMRPARSSPPGEPPSFRRWCTGLRRLQT